MYKPETELQKIIDNISFVSANISLQNAVGLFDNNRASQSFYKKLLKLICNYDLVELDIENEIVNYPAIDLGDPQAKVAIQVTSDPSASKIKATIDKFVKSEFNKIYTRLIILIIGKSRKKYKLSDSDLKGFNFDTTTDIWDDARLIRRIRKLDDNSLYQISNFLQSVLEIYKFPDHLYHHDIAEAIKILKRDWGTSDKIYDQRIFDRQDDFIQKHKNPLNKLSWEYFKKNISPDLSFNVEIQSFLRDPINISSLTDYYNVTQAIQDFYFALSEPKVSFEEMFIKIYDKVNILYGDSLNNKKKILILLHNMYFNCDIGSNDSSQN